MARLDELPALDQRLVLVGGGKQACEPLGPEFAIVDGNGLLSLEATGLAVNEGQLLRELRQRGVSAKQTGSGRAGRHTVKPISIKIAHSMAREGVRFDNETQRADAVRNQLLAEGHDAPTMETVRRHLLEAPNSTSG